MSTSSHGQRLPELHAWESYEETAKAARALRKEPRTRDNEQHRLDHRSPSMARLIHSEPTRPHRNSLMETTSAPWSHYSQTGLSARVLRPRRQTLAGYEKNIACLGDSRNSAAADKSVSSSEAEEEGTVEQQVLKLPRIGLNHDIIEIFGVYFGVFTGAELKGKVSMWRRVLSMVNATMPWLQEYIATNFPVPQFFLFFELCFRGIGQVYFQNNPVTGLFIFIGLYIQSSRIATHGLIAIVLGNLVALAFGFDQGLILSGLFGYNPYLVGLALATFSSPEKHKGWDGAIVVLVIIGAISATVLWQMMGKLLNPYKSPPLTLPFNVATLVLILASGSMNRYELNISNGTPVLPDYSTENINNESWGARQVFAGTVRGIGQVFLADNIVSGCLVLVGIALSSRISAFAAFFGSLLGAVMAIAAGVQVDGVESGLYGFDCSLTVTAILMFYSPSVSVFIMAILAGILTVVVQFTIMTLFLPYALPYMTLPFCLVALPFIIIQGTTKRIVAIPLASLTVPEDHRERVDTINRGFRLLKAAITPGGAHASVLLAREAATTRHGYQFWKRISDTKQEAWVENCSAELFQIMDGGDRQGSITSEQFINLVAAAGLMEEAGVEFACKAFDLVNDGAEVMTTETFIKFASISYSVRRAGLQLDKFFTFVDLTDSGTICFDELDTAREYLGQPALTEAERKNLMAMSSSIAHGPCDEEEFDVTEFDVTELEKTILLEYIKSLIAPDSHKRSSVIKNISNWRTLSSSGSSSR